MSVPCTSINKLKHVLLVLNSLLTETLDIHSLVNVLSHLQINLTGLKQVHNLLIVYLQETTLHQELQRRPIAFLVNNRLFSINAVKDVLEGSLHDTTLVLELHQEAGVFFAIFELQRWALDGEGLARTRLAVGEDGPVVALETAVGDWAGDVELADVFVERRRQVHRYG